MTNVLIVSLGAFRLSTRPRKAALILKEESSVTFLAPALVGRAGRWDRPGRWNVDGIDIQQLDVRKPRLQPTIKNQVFNILFCYIPALASLARRAVGIEAEVVIVGNPALALIGIVHRIRHRSKIILDIPERPGLVTARGSVASLFSRLEILVLRLTSGFVLAATVVTQPDVKTIQHCGYGKTYLVRNAPLREWRAPFRPPARRIDDLPFRVLALGSIFEGRGYEILLNALALAREEVNVQLTICGPGRDDYVNSLKQLADQLHVAGSVCWLSGVPNEQVSATYLEAHVAMVLYESHDPGNDGLSNKILESVASGRPVIASDLPENRRFVSDNGVGWLTNGSPEAVAEAMIAAATYADLDELCRHCRDLSDTWLSWEAEFEPISALVHDLHI